MKKVIILFFPVILFSCQKDESPAATAPPDDVTSYYPLTTGSYWIYQRYILNADSVFVSSGSPDSIAVTGDTLINGNVFKTIEKYNSSNNTGNVRLARDSSGYIINEEGRILMSYVNFTEIIAYDTLANPGDTSSIIYTMTSKMENSQDIIEVPSGSFVCIEKEGTVISAPQIPVPNPRYVHTYYALNIGQVKEISFYFSNSTPVENRLISYHIEP